MATRIETFVIHMAGLSGTRVAMNRHLPFRLSETLLGVQPMSVAALRKPALLRGLVSTVIPGEHSPVPPGAQQFGGPGFC